MAGELREAERLKKQGGKWEKTSREESHQVGLGESLTIAWQALKSSQE